MPNDNDKPVAPATETEKKTSAKDETKGLKAENAELRKRIEELEAAATAKAEVGEADNYVVLHGKRHDIERTVTAKFATDEARKGFIDLDAELVVLKR